MTVLGACRERLAVWARGLPPVVVDVIIALVCSLNIDLQAVVDDHLHWWVPVLAAAYSLPLLWRRRFPFAVAAITGAGSTFLAPATGLLGQFPGVQLVATYTFAALSPPVKRLIAAACTALGVTLSIVLAADEVINVALVGMAFAVAYALGTAARARQDRITMLEERTAEERDAAAVRERQRIAREMHDILAHSMSMIAIQAEAGPVIVRSDPDKAEQVFDTISETARESLAQLRRALGVLRAGESHRRPQPDLDALPALIAGVRDTGLTVTLEQDGDPRPIPPDLATAAYRIIQESLTNAIRHAAATTVRVRLEWRESNLHLEICDNGRGPAPSGDERGPRLSGDGGRPGRSDESRPGRRRSSKKHAPDPSGDKPEPFGGGRRQAEAGGGRELGSSGGGGHGVIGMRERAVGVGGELVVGAGPGGVGFRVEADLPMM